MVSPFDTTHLDLHLQDLSLRLGGFAGGFSDHTTHPVISVFTLIGFYAVDAYQVAVRHSQPLVAAETT